MVCLNDIFATVSEIVDYCIPPGAAQDSYSFLPALKGEAHGKRTAVILESNNGSFAIKKGKWKLLNCSGSGGWSLGENPSMPQCQLYDMEADPEETSNL